MTTCTCTLEGTVVKLYTPLTNLFEISQHEVEVERERGDEVDDVDRCTDEVQPARTDREPHQQLKREPSVAQTLDVEERLVRFGFSLIENPTRSVLRRRWCVADEDLVSESHVTYRRHSHARKGFHAETEDRDEDEEHGKTGHDLV